MLSPAWMFDVTFYVSTFQYCFFVLFFVVVVFFLGGGCIAGMFMLPVSHGLGYLKKFFL